MNIVPREGSCLPRLIRELSHTSARLCVPNAAGAAILSHMPKINRGCLDAVRQHLKQCFPDWAVAERWDGNREAQTFRLTKPSEPAHLLEVRRNVLDNHGPEELSVLLKYQAVGQSLAHADRHRLLLCARGLEPI
jgi:hypothetical protein